MKILFGCYSPTIISGYSTQLRKLIRGLLIAMPSLEIGVICWDFIPPVAMYGINYIELKNIQINHGSVPYEEEDEVDFLNKVTFFLPGQIGDTNTNNVELSYWKILHIYSIIFNADKVVTFMDIFPFPYYDLSLIKM